MATSIKVAQFASTCRSCKGTIRVGQTFKYWRKPGMKAGVGYHMPGDCDGQVAVQGPDNGSAVTDSCCPTCNRPFPDAPATDSVATS